MCMAKLYEAKKGDKPILEEIACLIIAINCKNIEC
jgi:hypothetical protein